MIYFLVVANLYNADLHCNLAKFYIHLYFLHLLVFLNRYAFQDKMAGDYLDSLDEMKQNEMKR